MIEREAIEYFENKLFNYKLSKKLGSKLTEEGLKECEATEIILNLIKRKK